VPRLSKDGSTIALGPPYLQRDISSGDRRSRQRRQQVFAVRHTKRCYGGSAVEHGIAVVAHDLCQTAALEQAQQIAHLVITITIRCTLIQNENNDYINNLISVIATSMTAHSKLHIPLSSDIMLN
jgi:hypothetical protein